MPKYQEWNIVISDLYSKLKAGEIIPDPDWQRSYIWHQKDEQLLIDTIIRNMPMPNFYLTSEFDNRTQKIIQYVIDGQQRVTAIRKFIDNEFPISLGSNEKKFLFNELDKKTQEHILTYRLNGHYMIDFEQKDIHFLFERLNSTGIKVNNMEKWNSKFARSNVLEMIKEIWDDNGNFYGEILYTRENINRKQHLDDIVDLCNCLRKKEVSGAGKKELEEFLSNNKDIALQNSGIIKQDFRKTISNIKCLFNKADLQSSLFAKRTHFVSLFLSIMIVARNNYICHNPQDLRDQLVNFIENPPDDYKESVLGGIRHREKRRKRVKLLSNILENNAKKLDPNRRFPDELKRKLWRESESKVCGICGKKIHDYGEIEVDHKVPWSKGGETVEDNAQLAHKRCNSSKRDTQIEELILS